VGSATRSGPGSIAWKVNREVVVLAGWAPAILMQFAHPLVAAGVAEHSGFATDAKTAIKRLRATVGAMLALTFGTSDQADAAGRGINRIHDRVNGTLRDPSGPFPAGTSYSAHDPELLRWVHATLLDVLPRAYRLLVGPLSDAEWDTYCGEVCGMEQVLGAPPGFFPNSLAALRRYMAEMGESGHIVVTPTARTLARQLLHPPFTPLAEPGLAVARLAAVGLLRPELRVGYGFRWSPRRETALDLVGATSRAALARAPSLTRDWPIARRASRVHRGSPLPLGEGQDEGRSATGIQLLERPSP
jgi:uncharacterized protein (DUF2236 family)